MIQRGFSSLASPLLFLSLTNVHHCYCHINQHLYSTCIFCKHVNQHEHLRSDDRPPWWHPHCLVGECTPLGIQHHLRPKTHKKTEENKKCVWWLYVCPVVMWCGGSLSSLLLYIHMSGCAQCTSLAGMTSQMYQRPSFKSLTTLENVLLLSLISTAGERKRERDRERGEKNTQINTSRQYSCTSTLSSSILLSQHYILLL